MPYHLQHKVPVRNRRKNYRLLEKDREYSELVKRDGCWYTKKRYIATDSCMPAMWDATYKHGKLRSASFE
jgi:hypothetical protein